jgi:hypothetical protein
MNRIYCTYFDKNYMIQGLTMIDSLRKCGDLNTVYILALDKESYITLNNLGLQNIVILNTSEVENQYPELHKAKRNRNTFEYFFTLTPALIKFVRSLHADKLSLAVYLDADLFFFSNPNEILSKMDSYSVGIIPHRFDLRLAKKLNRFGKYNVGMVAFKSDSDGMRLLDWWFTSCIEWCYDYVDQGRFADQRYLDYFEQMSTDVLVINHLGANLAPWNVNNYKVFEENGDLYVNSDKLIFFHFHKLTVLYKKMLIPHIYYRAHLTKTVKNKIYSLYASSLSIQSKRLNVPLTYPMPQFRRPQGLLRRVRHWISILVILVRRDFVYID